MSQSQNVRKEFGALSVDNTVLSGTKGRFTTLSALSTLTMTDSGQTFYLSSATEFATTLPAVADAAGFNARFVVGAAPSGASYTVVSPAADIHGLLASKDLNGATDSAATAGTAVATVTFVDAKAAIGDYVDLTCDGTFYYVSGSTTLFDSVTLS
jgi:hypothetical protein